MPVEIVKDFLKIECLQNKVSSAAHLTRVELHKLPADPMEALYGVKFKKYGYHYLKDDRLDLVEQLNQSFTVMASLAAARRLLSKFPDCGGLRLNLATTRGWDIESIRPGCGGSGGIRSSGSIQCQ